MDKATALSLIIALIGIIALQVSQETKYTPVSIEHLEINCEGEVEIQGKIEKTFHSNRGNYIGIVSEEESEVPVIINEKNVLPGDKVKILGRASSYREDCFIFPDKVEIRGR